MMSSSSATFILRTCLWISMSWTLFFLSSSLAVRPGGPRYQHFEDYLSHLNVTEQEWISRAERCCTEDKMREEQNEQRNGLLSDGSSIPPPNEHTSRESTVWKNKEVMCCTLGQMAGDKGYHCYAKFYVARLLLRNRNRAHNRKMAFHGHERVSNYGRRLMQTFQRCVAGRGSIFHKCCHLAALERSAAQPRYDTQRRNRTT